MSRAKIYELFATALTCAPTLAVVEAVHDMSAVLRVSSPGCCDLQDLTQDFNALFVVPGSRYVAPYESVYRDSWQSRVRPGYRVSAADTRSQIVKGLLMGDSTLDVQVCYREAGVFPEGEIPDHIGNELRFMAYLCHRRAAGAEDIGRLADLQRRFRDDHLLKWLDLLRKRIGESEQLGFYSVVVHLAEIVLRNDT